MAASADDLFMKVGDPGTATTLGGSGYTIGATSITVVSTTNYPTDTGIIFGIDTVEIDAEGNEVRVDGSYCIFEGVVTSSTTIGSVTKLFGDDQNYSAGATTRVYITVSTEHTNRLIEGILTEHTQTGSHVMTSPKVITGINDTNGNELIKVTATGSAVNELTIANAATGNNPVLSATGSDTNIGITLTPKGTGKVTIADSTNIGGSWTSWTPTLTNITIGNGTVTAKYIQIGKTVFYDIYILFGSTSSTGGNISYSLPVTSISYSSNAHLGSGFINNTGTAQFNGAAALYSSTTVHALFVLGASATFTNLVAAGNTTPGSFGNGSYISIQGRYEAA